jgi:MFS family permease
MFLALGIWVKTLTGSNAAAGMVFFVYIAPALAAPLAGLVVDRVRRRRLMIVTDLSIGALLLVLLLVRGPGQVGLIYVVTFVYGCSAVVFGSARSALLTVMLPEDLLPDANGALQSVGEGLRLVAPLAGAGLFAAFGGGTVAILDAATFAASAVCLAALRVRERSDPRRPEQRFVDELSAGVRHVLGTTGLRDIVLTIGVALLVIGFAESFLFAVVDQGLHHDPSFLGVLVSVQGAGAVIGGLTAAAAIRRFGDGRLVAIGLLLTALGESALLTDSLPAIVIGIVGVGIGIAWAVVGFATGIQTRTPPRLQGRAYSAADTIVSMPQTVSIAAGAALITVVDYRLLIVATCVVTAGCGFSLLTRRLPPAVALPAEAGQEAEVTTAAGVPIVEPGFGPADPLP